jgi:energy-coupling factor transporter ATP-binding protein EcfA2
MDTNLTQEVKMNWVLKEKTPPVIETHGLTKTFKGVEALKELDLQVLKNSICGFLGPNGAGKTTTIKLLLGLARPTEGSGNVFGLDIVRVPGVIPEQAWQANDPEIEGWWNPVRVIEQVRLPVLVINGDKDTNMDPIQGAYAWRNALEQAGDPNSRVELLPGINHFMFASESSCIEKQMQTFNQVLQDQGYGSMDEAFKLIQQEPGQHTPLSALPSAPEYLELIEEWLRNLKLYFNQ